MSNQSSIFGRVTEFLSETDIPFDDRKEVYEILLETFEDFGTKDLDEWLGIDPALDQVWEEKHPELTGEDE
jgi:hypothetical protein